MVSVLSALKYLNGLGIIHRNINPENILIMNITKQKKIFYSLVLGKLHFIDKVKNLMILILKLLFMMHQKYFKRKSVCILRFNNYNSKIHLYLYNAKKSAIIIFFIIFSQFYFSLSNFERYCSKLFQINNIRQLN